MTRSCLTAPPPPGIPVRMGTTLHLGAWCNGITGGKAYLEAEGRIGAPDEHHDYEVTL
ncbi:hypothetical protein [Nonomuraea sp. NPDC049695]|uniref:hypothetical protein n=1 Tax=Nonomuraea sp. NPDC049695 TaxID=3154734 RepID=UPI00341DBC2F